MYYYVVFNGFHVTEQKITSYSKNDKVCCAVACSKGANIALIVFSPALRSFGRRLQLIGHRNFITQITNKEKHSRTNESKLRTIRFLSDLAI